MTTAEFRALHADGQLTPAKTRTTRRALPARDGTPMACHCGAPIAGEAAWLRHQAEHGHHRLHCVDDAILPGEAPVSPVERSGDVQAPPGTKTTTTKEHE
jgi:hypothetical protein